MTSAASRYDLAIVGLGPVGAVAANIAGAMGLRTLVIERGAAIYDKPRAIVFDAEIMRVFAAIGLAETLARVTKPLGGSVYLGADRAPIRTFDAPQRAHSRAWHPSNLFYQPQLEGVLRDGLARFAHVEIVTGSEVTGIDQDGDGVTISHAGGSARADHLLACDGASSAVRKALGIALDDIGFEERWLVVDTNVRGEMRWPEGYAIPPQVRDGRYSLMVCDPARPATLIPGRGDHRRWEYMLMADESDELVTSDAWLKPQLAHWVDPDAVEIVRTAVYRFRALVAEQWRRGRIFLLGDAAHQTPPFFGQGMCHGIRDAAQLLWKLDLVRRGLAADPLLDSYQVEREPHVRTIIAASVAAGAEVCKLDRDEALERDARFREIERQRAGTVAMTDVVPPIRAGLIDAATGGARLPEFILATGGEERHVDELLAGQFALLSPDPLPLGGVAWPLPGWWPITGARDVDGRLDAWFDACGARWAIVRPDRYVYATGRSRAELDTALLALTATLRGDAAAAAASMETLSA